MQVFSLRKFRKGSEIRITSTTDMRATKISTAADCYPGERSNGGGGVSDDEGTFYDLEFAVPLETGDLEEFNMSVSSWGNRLSSSSSTSLTGEILFNGHLFSLESSSSSSSSMFFSPAASELSSKSQFPASMLKSAAKLRIFMFRPNLKGRPNSSAADIKFIKDVVLRYIRMIKPLYVKVSKLRFSGPSSRAKERSTGHGAGVKTQSKATQSSVPSRFKVVPRSLRKSRSASSAVASVYSPPLMTQRRDDSLLQQEDGIQAAIAYCKRSFHSEEEMWAMESPLLRSMSDSGREGLVVHGRKQGAHGGDITT